MVEYQPKEYHSVTPYLIIKGAAQAIEFYQSAFGAREKFRMPGAEGQVQHAEICIGDSVIMLADEFPNMEIYSPTHFGGTSVGLLIYVPDVDAQFKKALAAGARELKPVQVQFYGDRSGTLLDPFGHKWTLATHIEDVSAEQMDKRMQAMAKKG
ncbi:MAG: hypothetical protein HJJLKODD_02088 [Phycisphaerae bacterium]|nr:hypothetical protein [Phycisphaerae bacterium]